MPPYAACSHRSGERCHKVNVRFGRVVSTGRRNSPILKRKDGVDNALRQQRKQNFGIRCQRGSRSTRSLPTINDLR